MPNLFDESELKIQGWLRLWQATGVVNSVQCEWSTRLTSSLGLAYPQRRLVRLNCILQIDQYAPLFEEVLCHEVAHVAVFWVYGGGVGSHGKEWQNFLSLSGFEPRRLIHGLPNPAQTKSTVRYKHFCPVCHAQRMAWKPCVRWKCTNCLGQGLDGALRIVSVPSRIGVDK